MRYVEILLADNYILRSELKKAFGIGNERANYLADCLGLGQSFVTKHLNRFFEECLNHLTLINYDVNRRLFDLLKQHFLNMMLIKLIKTVRVSKGLSGRGQGTRSNCKQNRFYLIDRWKRDDDKEGSDYDMRGSTVKNLKLKSKSKNLKLKLKKK